MRFFTFLKQLSDQTFIEDEEVITFHNWIHSTDLPKSNPHAGIVQIKLYILHQNHSKTVWDGFVKTCLVYHKNKPDSLPKYLQQENELRKFLFLDVDE